MKILVANLGSTSLKYRLFAFADGAERVLAHGGVERITDYGAAIDQCLAELRDAGHLHGASELDAVGFKAILAKDVTGCVELTDDVIDAMMAYAGIAPAHNPVYAKGVRLFREHLPGVPMIGLFETSFYQWVPEAAVRYAVPESWHVQGVRRWGFHGASHKYIAERSAELLGRQDIARRARRLYIDGPNTRVDAPDLRVISCHLGGSSSVAGIRNGVAIGCSFGMSAQSGLPQNNRVGDLDAFALPYLMRTTGLTLDEAERALSKDSGLLGLSGVSNDVRDLEAAARNGNARAQLALDVFAREIRRWIGCFFLEMDGADAIVFTGGIGENSATIRNDACANLQQLGVKLDAQATAKPHAADAIISAPDSRVRVLTIRTNEELVVAREVARVLQSIPTNAKE